MLSYRQDYELFKVSTVINTKNCLLLKFPALPNNSVQKTKDMTMSKEHQSQNQPSNTSNRIKFLLCENSNLYHLVKTTSNIKT